MRIFGWKGEASLAGGENWDDKLTSSCQKSKIIENPIILLARSDHPSTGWSRNQACTSSWCELARYAPPPALPRSARSRASVWESKKCLRGGRDNKKNNKGGLHLVEQLDSCWRQSLAVCQSRYIWFLESLYNSTGCLHYKLEGLSTLNKALCIPKWTDFVLEANGERGIRPSDDEKYVGPDTRKYFEVFQNLVQELTIRLILFGALAS